jgi:hypothetical protein
MVKKIDWIDSADCIVDFVYREGRFFMATKNFIKASKLRDIIDERIEKE